MYARTAPAVPSGLKVRGSSWWTNEYISFSTTSVASPMARTKRDVDSTYGVRTSRKPDNSMTRANADSTECHRAISLGSTSFMPFTARRGFTAAHFISYPETPEVFLVGGLKESVEDEPLEGQPA